MRVRSCAGSHGGRVGTSMPRPQRDKPRRPPVRVRSCAGSHGGRVGTSMPRPQRDKPRRPPVRVRETCHHFVFQLESPCAQCWLGQNPKNTSIVAETCHHFVFQLESPCAQCWLGQNPKNTSIVAETCGRGYLAPGNWATRHAWCFPEVMREATMENQRSWLPSAGQLGHQACVVLPGGDAGSHHGKPAVVPGLTDHDALAPAPVGNDGIWSKHIRGTAEFTGLNRPRRIGACTCRQRWDMEQAHTRHRRIHRAFTPARDELTC